MVKALSSLTTELFISYLLTPCYLEYKCKLSAQSRGLQHSQLGTPLCCLGIIRLQEQAEICKKKSIGSRQRAWVQGGSQRLRGGGQPLQVIAEPLPKKKKKKKKKKNDCLD